MSTHNHLVLTGPSEVLEDIWGRHFTEDGLLDFETIVPMPAELRDYSIPTQEYDSASRQVLWGNWSALEERFPGITTCRSLENTLDFLRDAGHPELACRVSNESYLMETYGVPDDYSWSLSRWGTSLNAYEGLIEDSDLSLGTASWLSAKFETIDFAPAKAIEHLSKRYPEIRAYLSYQDSAGSWIIDVSFALGTESLREYRMVSERVSGVSSRAGSTHPVRGHRRIRLS